MADWQEVKEEGELLISGTVSREEFEAENSQRINRSLFDRRMKSAILPEFDGDDDVVMVEALVRFESIED